ncbi:MAG: hypothetical protein DDT33_01411 [Firmicutes bacterium]|nr:hypothetical protein [Bacillota bacterium]
MSKCRIAIDEDQVKRLYVEEGLTVNQIADMPGMTRSLAKIKKILIKQGVEVTCWCGIPLEVHVECGGCGILVGPKHITKTVELFLDGEYCSTCLEARKKLQCRYCSAYRIWYKHEIVWRQRGDIVIDGICRACDKRNRFVNRRFTVENQSIANR